MNTLRRTLINLPGSRLSLEDLSSDALFMGYWRRIDHRCFTIYSPLGEMIVSMTLDCRARDYFSLSVELSYSDALLDVHVSTSGMLYRRTSAGHLMESSKAVSMLICYIPPLYNLYRICVQFFFHCYLTLYILFISFFYINFSYYCFILISISSFLFFLFSILTIF